MPLPKRKGKKEKRLSFFVRIGYDRPGSEKTHRKGSQKMDTQRTILLHAEHLHKTYGSGEAAVTALNDVSLTVCSGELLVILGSSGSGKSTLLNLLGGMDSATSGSILIDGRDLCTMRDRELTAYRRDCVGFVFQSFNLIGELTARENVALVSADAEAVERALENVGLSKKGGVYPSRLSGGEQQRVAIARALVRRPKLLFCDEPTGALDYETGRQILKQIESACRKNGQTVVFVTHTKEIGRIADRVITMRSGKIIHETVNRSPVSVREIEW